MHHVRNFIDGAFVERVGPTFPLYAPHTGAQVAVVDEASAVEVDAAASRALRGPWSDSTGTGASHLALRPWK